MVILLLTYSSFPSTFNTTTGAMTLGAKSTPADIQAQRDRLPDVKPKQINLISDALKAELKDLINEVLDDRIRKEST